MMSYLGYGIMFLIVDVKVQIGLDYRIDLYGALALMHKMIPIIPIIDAKTKGIV